MALVVARWRLVALRVCLLSCWSEVRVLPGALLMNLLLAEDDAVARMTLSAVLKGLGYEVTEAEHGGEAWANLQLGYFPMVISDWSMPEVLAPERVPRLGRVRP